MKHILLVLLEFDTWQFAKPWSYTGSYAFLDGFLENGDRCTVLPAIYRPAGDTTPSFVDAAPEILAGERFDEAWVWAVHTHYEERFWNWLRDAAPVRVGIVMESLTHSDEEVAEFPHLAERRAEVLAMLRNCTHALLTDELDVGDVRDSLGIPAAWNLPMFPEKLVRYASPPKDTKAAFIGTNYGARRRYLADATLKDLLYRPTLPEQLAAEPGEFERVHREARQALANGTLDKEGLRRFAEQLHALRERLLNLTLDGIRLGFASINLPSIVKAYPGRIFEAMAASTPVVTWEIPGRTACNRLFEPNEEILRFASIADLTEQLSTLRDAPELAERLTIKARNTLLMRHTSRIRTRQYRQWITSGLNPNFTHDISIKPSLAEVRYYRNFISPAPYWSTTKPSDDERSRWEQIEGFIRQIRQNIGRPLRIVEIGCGRGWLANLCSSYGKVTAVEPVGDIIAHARSLFSQIDFLVGDAKLLAFLGLGESFDLVICAEGIERVPEAERPGFVADLLALIPPSKGYLIVSTPRGELREAWETVHGKPPQPVEHWISQSDLEMLFADTGCRPLLRAHAFLMDIYQIWLFAGPRSKEALLEAPTISFFSARHAPYYIAAPDYRQSSAGIRVLHYLCHALNQLGEEAYLIGSPYCNPHLSTPLLTRHALAAHVHAERAPIAVYPEVVTGNPFHCLTTARWLLNKPGHIGGANGIDSDELIFYFTEMCLPEGVKGQPLHIPTVDRRIFNNRNNPDNFERTDEYYYANKLIVSGGTVQHEKHPHALSLGLEVKLKPEELAARLRKAAVLYCYEPSSIVFEALACGCPVLIVESAYWNAFGAPEILASKGIRMLGEENAFEQAYLDLRLSYDPEIEPLALEARAFEQTREFIAITQATALINNRRSTAATSKAVAYDLWHPPKSLGEDSIQAALQQLEELLLPLDSLTKPAKNNFDSFRAYNRWGKGRQVLATDGTFMADHIHHTWRNSPRFHLIIRLRDGETALLADTLDSLNYQIFPQWHVDIISLLPPPTGIESLACLRWHVLEDEAHTKAHIDFCVASLRYDWVAEVPPGAVLDPLCLWRLADEINRNPRTSCFFVDDDQLTHDGLRHAARFKPGVNLEWLVSQDLAGPLFVARGIWREMGGASEFTGSPWFDQLLRLLEIIPAEQLTHVADVLISYTPAFPNAPEDCIRAMQRSGRRSGCEIIPVTATSWRLRYPMDKALPVSVAVLSRGQLEFLRQCLENLALYTRWPEIELLLVRKQTEDPELEAWLDGFRFGSSKPRQVFLKYDASWSEACNGAVISATHEHVLLLSEDTLVLDDAWLENLYRTFASPGIAAVSPRLVRPGEGKIAYAGDVLGLGQQTSCSPYRDSANLTEQGYLDCLQVSRDVSLLAEGCMLVRRQDYIETGGMDATEEGLAHCDLSLKLLARGKRLVYQPQTTLVYYGAELRDPVCALNRNANATDTTRAEIAFTQRWLAPLKADPFWNPNLSLESLQPEPETSFHATWQYLPLSLPRIMARCVGNAQGEYRVRSPLLAARRAGLALDCIWQQDTDRELTSYELARLAPDVLIAQNYLLAPRLAGLEAWRAAGLDTFIVYALDDLFTEMPLKSSLRQGVPANARTRFREALRHCDRMVVSTDFLAEAYRPLFPDIRVVANRLERERWLNLTTRKRTGKKPRIGWAGGTAHRGDLELIKPVIEATRDEADWIFMGMHTDEIRPLLSEFHPGVSFEAYPEALAALDLDIAVAPLEMHRFNQGKSNLRLLEYGALGLPVVCTDIDPYRASPACCLANDPQRWIEALRERIHDADAREVEGARMRQWVIQHYVLEDHLDEWLAAHLPGG